MSDVLVTIVTGFIIALAAGAGLLALLPRLQFRQTAYEDAPQTHQTKTGTPTMGGLAILASMLPAFAVHDPLTRWLLFLVFACGAAGFVDDYLAIRRGRNLGLRARTKYLLTALIAITFLRSIDSSTAIYPRDVIFHAGTYVLAVPHWLWLLLGIVAVTGAIHAVNLTDGLDGLVTGTIIPPLIVLLIVALYMGLLPNAHWSTVAALGIGGCFGFLWYNRHPARMFMGDTGSLALGALLSGLAILSGEMLLLVLIGGVFVAEALSVIIQVTYFKRTGGKRIFRMSPLHHHFELGGWPETKVTTRFWLASAVLSAMGLAIVR
jgi:phospho-N-acetylmuramoyl-pentapeptide-transferase